MDHFYFFSDNLLTREIKQNTVSTPNLITEANKIAEYFIRDHYMVQKNPYLLSIFNMKFL